MRGVIILLILIFLSQKAVSSITPAIHVPSDFNKNRFVNYNNAISNGSGNNTCDKVAFKNYYPSEYTSLKIKTHRLTLGFVGFLSMSSMMDTAQTGCFLKKSTLMKKQEYGKRKNTL